MRPLILSLAANGQPHSWINYEEAAYYFAKDLIAWSLSDDHFTIRGGISRMTGQQSKMKIDTIIAIKGNVSSKQLERINQVSLSNMTLFQRDHQICAYCGDHFRSADLTRDHITPTSRGGKNNWMNVVTACGHCNHKKGNRMPHECGMELIFLPYVPNRAEALILANKKILANQMDFLIERVPKCSRLLDANFTLNFAT